MNKVICTFNANLSVKFGLNPLRKVSCSLLASNHNICVLLKVGKNNETNKSISNCKDSK